MAAPRHVGPGIVKVRHPRPQTSRVASLTRADDALWERLFERADIVSEGAAGREGSSLMYRGSTSIILGRGDTQDGGLVRAAAVDPHLRLRAVRIARREAQVRAPGTLEVAQMDVDVRLMDGHVQINIEVDAQVDDRAVGADRLRL